MKALHFIYNGFSEYEVALACSMLAANGELHTASLNGELVKGEGNFTLKPDYDLREIQVDQYSLLLVSGMLDAKPYWDENAIFDVITEFDQQGKVLAAICGGPLFFAKAGVLKGKKYTCGIPAESRAEVGVFGEADFVDSDVVSDKNLVTAKGFATVDFALAIGDKLGLFNSESRKQFEEFWGGNKRV